MASIEELADYREILELRNRYCHYIDRGRYGDWASLFTEDGVFDTGRGEPFIGREAIQELGETGIAEKYEFSAHLMLNPVIDIDGDEATGQWYYYLLFTRSDGSVGWEQGFYDEEYTRVDGDWKFARVQAERRASQLNEVHTTES